MEILSGDELLRLEAPSGAETSRLENIRCRRCRGTPRSETLDTDLLHESDKDQAAFRQGDILLSYCGNMRRK